MGDYLRKAYDEATQKKGHSMTWEELKEEALNMGAFVEIFGEFIAVGDVYFWNYGEVNLLGRVIAKDRTPEQMWKIMEALK